MKINLAIQSFNKIFTLLHFILWDVYVELLRHSSIFHIVELQNGVPQSLVVVLGHIPEKLGIIGLLCGVAPESEVHDSSQSSGQTEVLVVISSRIQADQQGGIAQFVLLLLKVIKQVLAARLFVSFKIKDDSVMGHLVYLESFYHEHRAEEGVAIVHSSSSVKNAIFINRSVRTKAFSPFIGHWGLFVQMAVHQHRVLVFGFLSFNEDHDGWGSSFFTESDVSHIFQFLLFEEFFCEIHDFLLHSVCSPIRVELSGLVRDFDVVHQGRQDSFFIIVFYVIDQLLRHL